MDLVGAAHIQVLADDLLKQDAPRDGPVKDLREGELRLQDGDIVAEASRALLRREGMGDAGQPFP